MCAEFCNFNPCNIIVYVYHLTKRMMTPDLHERFITALKSRFPRKEIKHRVADLLGLSLDAAYRRVSGQVLFTPREIGIICMSLGISIDSLLYEDSQNIVWMPFILEIPIHVRSMDKLLDMIDFNLDTLINMSDKASSPEFVGIFNSLPLEFYIHSPILTKFMFFKWGRNFIGSEEFEKYSDWRLPDRLSRTADLLKSVPPFKQNYYVWDAALIWSLVRELDNLYRMRVMTSHEMEEVRDALKEILFALEKSLNGTGSSMNLSPEMSFYVSNIDLGFTTCFFESRQRHFVTFLNNFCFCMIHDNPDSFLKLKKWADSFKEISKQISPAGLVERKLFFDNQHKLIDFFLG